MIAKGDIVLVSLTTGFVPGAVLSVANGLVYVRHQDLTTGCGFAELLVKESDCIVVGPTETASPQLLGHFLYHRLYQSHAYRCAHGEAMSERNRTFKVQSHVEHD